MKTSKRLLSVLLAVIMALSCSAAAFASQAFSGTVDGDRTILNGDTIAEGTVFTGKVTIDSKATVTEGTFKGAVTNNGTIAGGTFKGSVTNNGLIMGGTFDGSVANKSGKTIFISLTAGISGGTFNGPVTNSSSAIIAGGTFNNTVTNENGGSVAAVLSAVPVFNGNVNNAGTVDSGVFHGIIANTGTVDKAVSALVQTTADKATTVTVQGSPTVKGRVSVSGSNSSFVLGKNSILTVDDGAELTLNCACDINGIINLQPGAKLNSVSGSLSQTSGGTIRVTLGASFTGAAASKFTYITKKEYTVSVDSNVDKSQFTFVVADSAFGGDSVGYSFDFSGVMSKCLTINSITVYNGKKNDNNIIKRTSDIIGSFDMPDNNVIIYVDCTANHTSASDHKDPSCTLPGYDRTYCTKCGHELSHTELPAKGHSYSAWSYADENSRVLKTRTCSSCGNVDYAYIEIVNEAAGRNLTVDYKSTLTFHANAKAESGYVVTWYYTHDGKTETSTGETFTVNQATSDFTVKALITGITVPGSSEELKITVKHGLFDKIKAFFRGLFKKLPVYIDNVKQ